MKKLILTPLALALLLFSCAPDINLDLFGNGGTSYVSVSPGTPATFTIHESDSTTFEIPGDAYSVGYGFFDGPGSAMHKAIDSYEPIEYFYELECIGSYESGIQLYFDFYTDSNGQPLNSISTGTYYARNATYRHGNNSYQAFHYTDDAINQQLHAVIHITSKSEGRINGSFTGKYYAPITGQIVTISGEFKNVYVYDTVE